MGRVFADCDALLLPCTARPALRIGEYEGRGMVWTMNGGTRLIPFLGIWNATGQPAVSMPAGFTDDADKLPLAVQLVGRPDDEATLISLAGAARGRAPVGAAPAARFLVSDADADTDADADDARPPGDNTLRSSADARRPQAEALLEVAVEAAKSRRRAAGRACAPRRRAAVIAARAPPPIW